MKVNPYFTNGIKTYIEKGEIYESDVLGAMRFCRNDWGELSKEDIFFNMNFLNPKTLKNEGFTGVYTSFDINFLIMSNYDCTFDTLVITVLIP
ncbi:hypothetical protein [Clostridium sp.]|uniref:hypothetical protein n=1 Tax=Clostridium sp. TaxID=1506 RepID=UPI00290820A2|nr:hypothetical protein [Clostridium sp.]MDU6521610.1 hypothetical protein [Clostridium sp.]